MPFHIEKSCINSELALLSGVEIGWAKSRGVMFQAKEFLKTTYTLQ